MIENYTYYDGFESEPEYTFCLYDGNKPVEKIHLWAGYFCDILDIIPPDKDGWTGLAEYYQLSLEFENNYWKVPDILTALYQLENIDTSKINFPESHEVLEILIDMFKKACENNLTVYIEYF
ncbi:MAG: hypothetical protein K2J39_03910 [Ruminococcus sp.]|nr:hypothetical protein [Ruminococcus sp.]